MSAPLLPHVVEDETECPGFTFTSGARLDQRIHYRTLGQPRILRGNVDNAVLLLHGTTGNGKQFLEPSFAAHMFGPGQPLDTRRYFIVMPDALGHGQSSKPSDGAYLAFPQYGYRDIVAGYAAVVRHLNIHNLRLVLGTSMGGMQAWLWASSPPVTSDAYVAVACEPVPVTGRNLYWRQLICSAIRQIGCDDSARRMDGTGAYHAVWPVFALMSGSPESFDGLGRDEVLALMGAVAQDAPEPTDLLYAIEASYDYDPQPDQVHAPLTAVTFDTDEVNPQRLSVVPEVARRVAAIAHYRRTAEQAPDGHKSLHQAQTYAQAVASLLSVDTSTKILDGETP